MRVFRPAREVSVARHLAVTLAQTALFWAVFLVGLPWAIALLEARLGIPGFRMDHQHAVAAAVALAMAALNLSSGIIMATCGLGTPLPTHTARRLVIRGPYRHVRNPMAIGGLGLGAALGIAVGSWAIIAYVLAGGVLWHAVARPMEEADLLMRFGEPYANYRTHVRNWWPRLRPYRP